MHILSRIKLFFFLIILKSLSFFLRLTNRGGTALPGLLLEKYFPRAIPYLASQVPFKIIITGTNGKTTTARLLADIFKVKRWEIVHNQSGANLIRGIASELIRNASLFGKIEKNIGIFEIEEASIPEAVELFKPNILIVTNLFRDQLDAYGELDRTKELIEQGVQKLSESATVILDSDDPRVLSIKNKVKSNVVLFGLEDSGVKMKEEDRSADSKRCPECGKPLAYSKVYYNHLGVFMCRYCKFKRAKPDVSASKIKIQKDLSSNFLVSVKIPASKVIGAKRETFLVNFKAPGIYNIYNALAAIAAGKVLRLKNEVIQKGFEIFQPAFGRGEEIEIDGKSLKILLVKNPAGFNSVLSLLSSQRRINLLIALNDNIADGRDVSWIWDTQFEMLKIIKPESITVTGIRSKDMKLRLKYAGLERNRISEEPNLQAAFERALGKVKKDQVLFVLPTYTAMLDLRRVIGRRVEIRKFWEG